MAVQDISGLFSMGGSASDTDLTMGRGEQGVTANHTSTIRKPENAGNGEAGTECDLAKVDVAGSSPVSRSRKVLAVQTSWGDCC